MGRLSTFQFLTLNGFYKGPDEDTSWHRHGGEESDFASEGAQSGSILLFGRTTYDMMASWWPTAQAKEAMPGVAKGMNESQKIVVSRSLKKASWQNTRIVNDLLPGIRQLKQESTNDITLLGSGTILTQLASAGLIDVYQFMIDPVALGQGTTILQGLEHQLDLQLTSHRVFNSGVVLLTYEPLKN